MKRIFDFFSKYRLLVSFLVVGAFFFIFYPSTYVTIDEHDYLYNAVNITEGTLQQECTAEEWSQFKANGYCVYKYNIGTSFFYIPAALLDLRLSFLSSLVVFFLGIFLFDKILQLYKVNSFFTYLYTLFPAFIYYSRTLFSEIYSATFVLMFFYFLLKFVKEKKFGYGVMMGIGLGFSILIRYTNILPLGILLLGVFIMDVIVPSIRKKVNLKSVVSHIWKFLVPILLGGLPFLIFFLLFNDYLYGEPLRSGYSFSHEESAFVLSNIPSRIYKYVGALLLLYPGMLVGGILSKNRYRWIIFAISLILVLMYSSFPADKFEGRIVDLILGVRYFVPVIPLLMVTYVQFLNKFVKMKYFRLVLLGVLTFLCVNVFQLNWIHQDFLEGFPGI